MKDFHLTELIAYPTPGQKMWIGEVSTGLKEKIKFSSLVPGAI